MCGQCGRPHGHGGGAGGDAGQGPSTKPIAFLQQVQPERVTLYMALNFTNSGTVKNSRLGLALFFSILRLTLIYYSWN